MKVDVKTLVESWKALPRVPADFSIEEESQHLADITQTMLSQQLGEYEAPTALGAGGSGLVVSALYVPFGSRRAIKIPRKRLFEGARGEFGPEDPEIHALSKLSHKSITRLYDHFPLEQGRGYCMVTEFVEDSQPLDEFAHALCCTDDCKASDHTRAESIRHLASVIYEVVDALQYMHEDAHLLHFDLKPDNILVSDQGKPFVTDLGFARDLEKYKGNEEVEIGFTWKYSHPELSDPYRGGRVSQTPAKSRNSLPASRLSKRFDLFAFGRTLQEALFRLQDVHGESIHSDYAFNYLHVIASLCLDGRNAAYGAEDTRRSFVSDAALGLPTAVFQQHQFSSFSDVKRALERLLGRRRLEDEVPEIDQWSASTLNVTSLGVTTMTPRVKALMEHPAVARLSSEGQLGMLDTIFPTATHSRLQHVFGTYHAVRDYLAALYYDPENPTFRILFRSEDGEATLVASILHDLGQTSFAHELEEVDKAAFDHARISELLIHSEDVVDRRERTLRDLVEGTEFDCWGLRLDRVTAVLSGKSDRPFDAVLHDILDGQLDADKLDYLVRDSIECRIPYGSGIDYQRFLRTLTTAATQGHRSATVRLAVKRKGAASAEAFAFARYQLYQSAYWHHTFRATKAMFLTAAASTLDRLKGDDMFGLDEVRNAYVDFVILKGRLTASMPRDELGAPLSTDSREYAVHRLLRSADEPSSSGKYGRDDTVRFLWKLASEKERSLLDDLIRRRYYKRAVEVPMSAFSQTDQEKLRVAFDGPNRLNLQSRVERSLQNTLATQIQDQSRSRESIVADELMETIHEILDVRFGFLVDLPLRGWMGGGNEPLFISDYKRRHFRTVVGRSEGQHGSIWSDHMGGMMEKIAFFRVYCEPELHRIVTRVLQPSDLFAAIQDELGVEVPSTV